MKLLSNIKYFDTHMIDIKSQHYQILKFSKINNFILKRVFIHLLFILERIYNK